VTWRCFSNCAAIVALATALVPSFALAQTARDLAGSWAVVSVVTMAADGTPSDLFGPSPRGQYMFDERGRFAIVTGRSDLPRFASDNRDMGTAEENQAVVRGSIALSGTYTVTDKVVTLKIEAGTWPNWIGNDQRRNVASYTGNELKWIFPTATGGTTEVTLRRIGERTAAATPPANPPQGANSLPAPTPTRVNRFVPTGEERMVIFYTSLFVDCSSRGPTVGRITTKPRHGSIRLDQGDSFPFYAATSPLTNCNSKKVPGLMLNYKSEDGYVGEDMASILVILPDGAAVQLDLLLLVR
jgi:Lipocalin-like domain